MAFSSGRKHPLSFLASWICLAEVFRILSRNPACQLVSESVRQPLQHLVLASHFSSAEIRPSDSQPCPEHHLQVVSLHSRQQLPSGPFFSTLLSMLLSPLPGLGSQAGHWRPQASWSLEFPVVGKENAGGGDCSGPEKRSRKECMKTRRQRR